MKVDILFWFYKDFDVCRERLSRVKRINSEVYIYALYGGPNSEMEVARDSISDLVDDFYAYPHERDTAWKWEHGDQIIVEWYLDRGQYLKWETIFIMQWDMLILDSFASIFNELRSGEALFSGFVKMDEISSWWCWADPNNPELISFKKTLLDKFKYDDELFACLFIVICLPRIFFQKYILAGYPKAGFLEYKFPTMAHIFNIPICTTLGFTPWWATNPDTKNVPITEKTLNAVGQEIPLSIVLKEIANSSGKRLFHPVYRKIPRWMENRFLTKIFLFFAPVLPYFSITKRKIALFIRAIGRK